MDELKRRQLARLKGESLEPINAADDDTEISYTFVFDREAFWRDLKQPTRTLDSHPYLEAIPYPCYPAPGEPLTPEIEREHFEEVQLWTMANRALTDCVYWLRCKHIDPQHWNDIHCGSANKPPGATEERVRTKEELYGETWSWLLGLWTGKGMTPVSEEEMLRLALPERYTHEEA